MNFLKTLFWIVFSAVVVLFSINNWVPVEIRLWDGLEADVKLPVLLLFIFLCGFIPAIVYYRTKNWRLNRRLGTVERQLSDARGISQFRSPARTAKSAEPEAVASETQAPTGPLTPETSAGETQ